MLGGLRDVRLLGLPGDVLCAASRLGIHTAEDLEGNRELTQKYFQNDQRVPTSLQLHYRMRPCAEILQSGEFHHITACSQSLDALLGGGIHMGQVYELCGHPGAGKTQMGIQLAVNVQLPSFLGGVSGECLFIDTEGSVMPQRVAEIARGTLKWAQPTLQANAHRAEVSQLSEAKLLGGIHYLRVKSAAQQVAACSGLLYTLPPSVRLVVLDSVAFLFRVSQYAVNKNVSVRMLHNMMTGLRKLAARGVAVVLTNHVVCQDRNEILPALGDSWSCEPMHRIQLQVTQETRIARVWKSSCLPPGWAEYAVTGDGVRDVNLTCGDGVRDVDLT